MADRSPSAPPDPRDGVDASASLAEVWPQVAAELIAAHERLDATTPVRPHHSAQALESALPLRIDGRSRPWPEAIALLHQVLALTPSTTSPRFFNQLFGGRDRIATLAEIATILGNSPMHTFKASGVQVLIEREVLRRMGTAAGMAEGDGLIAPGGSMSNLAAMIMARNEAVEGARERGLPGTRLCVYTSAAGHYSVRKAAGMIGIGRQGVRTVPTDAEGRMRVDALAAMIDEDRAAGAIAVMINATACTTVLGAFDPLPALADLATDRGVWLHVDAAYGGSILVSPRHRHLLAGCERADSLTWDAHKLLGVPLTCSALLTRRPGLCARHFEEPASYLFQDDALVDPGRGSLQCARHNDALKLWLSWQHHGDEGLARRIDRLFELARHAAAFIEAHPRLRLLRPPASINVCFDVPGISSQRLCRTLWEREVLTVGHAIVDGHEVVRWVFVNPEVEPEAIEAMLIEVDEVAQDLRAK